MSEVKLKMKFSLKLSIVFDYLFAYPCRKAKNRCVEKEGPVWSFLFLFFKLFKNIKISFKSFNFSFSD